MNLKATAEEYGDERRSPLRERGEAQAFNEKDLLTSRSPLPRCCLTKAGCVLLKGHEIDPTSLSYKSGDKFLAAALWAQQSECLLAGFQLAVSTLWRGILWPSARGQGEPATGRLNLPSGALFTDVLMGADDQKTTAGHRRGLWLYRQDWRPVYQEQSG